MVNGTALKLIRAFSSQAATAEGAPTTASAFVSLNDESGGHFTKAKLVAGALTTTGSPTSIKLQVWYKQGSVVVAGPQKTVTVADGAMSELDLGVVPSESFYVTSLGITGGSAPTFTMSVYGMKYNDDDAA